MSIFVCIYIDTHACSISIYLALSRYIYIYIYICIYIYIYKKRPRSGRLSPRLACGFEECSGPTD